MSRNPSHAVELSLETVREPSPAQQAAWTALWRRLLAPPNESPAPAMQAGTGLECAREPDAPMDHDREVINGPTT
jgi:hypothetical protein